jgi:hypothetical protein
MAPDGLVERATSFTDDDPDALKDLGMSYAILTDKRRIEEGPPTSHAIETDAVELFEAGQERLRVMRGGHGVDSLPMGTEGEQGLSLPYDGQDVAR